MDSRWADTTDEEEGGLEPPEQTEDTVAPQEVSKLASYSRRRINQTIDSDIPSKRCFSHLPGFFVFFSFALLLLLFLLLVCTTYV
jgi:hypothetical protein